MVNNSCGLNISIKNMQWQKKKKAGCSPQMPVPGHYSHFYIRQPYYITDKYNRKKIDLHIFAGAGGFQWW